MRYSRNENMLTPEENRSLRDFRVCVIGCGGLGGNIIEQLGRIGIGHITAVDGDVFDSTNLNRQILSTEENLGKSKAEEAKRRMAVVNSEVNVYAVHDRLTEDNANELLAGHDLVMDALDNVKARFVLQRSTKALGIPFVHGAISGWYGQVSTVFPGDDTLYKLYPNEDIELDNQLGNPSFTPAMIASFQVAEAVKVLLERGDTLRNKVFVIDSLEHEYNVLDLGEEGA